MSDANSKDYTADLTRLQRYRDKVQPTNAKAFSGDITNSSFSDMVCELELQLATKDLLEFTEFPGTELPPAAIQAVDPPPAPVLRVGAESADHRTRRLAAFIGAQFVILLSLLTFPAREFASKLHKLLSFSLDPTVDTIVNRLRAKFLPANYSRIVHLGITNFHAPPTMRPSSILEKLRHLNRQLVAPAAFSDAQLLTLFIGALDPAIRTPLVLVQETDLDNYAALADAVFDQPLFALASAPPLICNALQGSDPPGHQQSATSPSRNQGRSNPFQQYPPSSPNRRFGSSSPSRSATPPPRRVHDNGLCYNCKQDIWLLDVPVRREMS